MVLLLTIILVIVIMCVGVYIWGKKPKLLLMKRELPSTEVNPGSHLYYHDSEPVELSDNEAVVVQGRVPTGTVYWGLTGYKANDDAPIADTIKGDSLSYGYSLAVVLTSNSALFEGVKKDLLDAAGAYKHLLKVEPIYVQPSDPRDQYFIRMTLLTASPERELEPWKATHYRTPRVKHSPGIGPPLVEASRYPREESIVSTQKWNEACLDSMEYMKYVVRREVEVDPGDPELNKLGLSINRDATTFVASVELREDESLVVVAANHASTMRGRASTVSFHHGDRMQSLHITGDRIRNPSRSQGLESRIILHQGPEEGGNVSVVESIYSESRTRVGPCPKSVHRMKVYVVDRVS